MTLAQKIRRALGASEPQTLSVALTFASAIWHVRPTRASHAPMLMLLPAFIDAELDRQSAAPKFRALKRHLLICPRCATIYFALLETARLDAQHEIPKPSTLPRPDLDFLKSNDTGD